MRRRRIAGAVLIVAAVLIAYGALARSWASFVTPQMMASIGMRDLYACTELGPCMAVSWDSGITGQMRDQVLLWSGLGGFALGLATALGALVLAVPCLRGRAPRGLAVVLCLALGAVGAGITYLRWLPTVVRVPLSWGPGMFAFLAGTSIVLYTVAILRRAPA